MPGLRILIPDRALWNGGVFQVKGGIPNCRNGSNLGEGAGHGVLCKELGLKLHFRLKDNLACFRNFCNLEAYR